LASATRFARSIGLELPQFQAYGTMMSVEPLGGPEVSVWGNGISWRRQPDGGYTLCSINGAAPIMPTTLRYLPKLIPALTHLWDELDPVLSASNFWRGLRLASS
jgi:glycine/D-amino acid oxidase-like deaminating enzyme